jgi:hypothetical protein
MAIARASATRIARASGIPHGPSRSFPAVAEPGATPALANLVTVSLAMETLATVALASAILA